MNHRKISSLKETVAVIGGKWRLLIVFTLLDKPRRFVELKDRMGCISPKMLSKELKGMVRDGLIKRTV